MPVPIPSFKPVRLALHLSLALSIAVAFSIPGEAQASAPSAEPPAASSASPQGSLAGWAGLHVVSIQFEGVPKSTLDPLPAHLQQQPGQPLEPLKVRDSLRRLYATGLYQTIEVSGVRAGDDVTIIFSGAPRLFIGRVDVKGIKDDRLTSVLRSSAQLELGAPYSPSKVVQADAAVKSTLEDNGFYQSHISGDSVIDKSNSLIDLNYTVTTGKAARVGDINVQGNSGLTEQQFRKQAKLKRNSKVNRNTINRALTNLRKNYAKTEHLASTISLTSKQYLPTQNHVNYSFQANEGPIVTVSVEGAKISRSEIQKLVPVYEEGSVDEDLLNEGALNLRSFFQAQGYFDVQVSHKPLSEDAHHATALYTVSLGPLHVVDSVTVTGNKYFSSAIIDPRISVRPATLVDRHGSFSQQKLSQDVNSIKALYQSNGFSNVRVTPKIIDLGNGKGKNNKKNLAHLKVVYQIEEGTQQRIGKYEIVGASAAQIAQFKPFLNTQPGQPYSTVNISQDRDLVRTYYLDRGYDNVQVELFQETEQDHKDLVDLSMNITEGHQFFVRKVITTGLHYTRPSVVDDRVMLHPDEPLNQTALLETQRKLYDLALFNEVNTAIQNPEGNETYKNVLLNMTEAKRWDINYGFGFEAQTGTPANSYTPNGKFSASPRVLFNISRINLRGTDQSITLRTNFGTLEQLALLTYQDPHVILFPKPDFNLTLSGGYDNTANISTYQASVVSGALRLAQRANKANTLIYSFAYRRVAVKSSTLQVSPALVPLLSQPTRVGGPGLTWIRDTRDVALDAHRGSFTSVVQFLADSEFGSQANFNRIDITNSTYYEFGRDHWVFARQTRYGQERAFGNGDEQLIPLPERLYAGGATSHRGFGINSAGPRDPQTGYPIGGSGVFVNTSELRSPAPQLPFFGNNLSFVLFHDMGNVYENSSAIWSSFFRIKQPHSYTCRDVSKTYSTYNTPDTCDFNDSSHAMGLGLRYHTPIGPVRADFSYNLNPPIYPVIYDYTSTSPTPDPHVGSAGHFNFFFSIGQSF